jgi:hypothetical protein
MPCRSAERTKGKTWQGFPAHSPPVFFNYSRVDGKDLLALFVGSPGMRKVAVRPLNPKRQQGGRPMAVSYCQKHLAVKG